MSMSMYNGKTICYEGDAIGLSTKVEYSDQNGNACIINMQKFIALCKKSTKSVTCKKLVADVTNETLVIGFPIIVALNDLAEEFGKQVNECIEVMP